MDARELSDLVAYGQVQPLVRRLSGLNETQRKALAPGVRQLLEYRGHNRYPAWPLVLAALGCLGGERQVARGLGWVFHVEVPDDGTAAQVLRDRNPRWLEKLPRALLGDEGGHWALVRRLVRDGVVSTPEEPGYFLGMVNGVLGRGWRGDVPFPIRSALLSDGDLLDRDLWQMLATERVGRVLASTDGFLAAPHLHDREPMPAPTPERTWSHALATLAGVGRIDRGRLLDAALAAPLRDWAAVDVTWFLGLHDRLAPVPDEVIERQATYMRLLGCEHGPAVKAAQRCLTGVLGDDRLDVVGLLSASESTLGRADKATVVGQLTLLKTLHRHHPELAEPVGRAVSVALDHPRADVRERAAGLLSSLGHAAARPAVVTEFVAPEPVQPPDPKPVTPVTDPDELADLMLRLVEGADDPIEVERAFEGAVRFAGQTSAAGAVLLRRLDDLEVWGDLRNDLIGLARAWLVKPTFRRRLTRSMGVDVAYAHKPREGSLAWFHRHRVDELVRAASDRSGVVLSLPTHADGSITPDVLAARLDEVGRRDLVGGVDLGLALLRVPRGQLNEDLVPRRLREPSVRAAIRLMRDWTPDWERVSGLSKGFWRFSPEQPVVTYRLTEAPSRDGGPVSRLADRRDALSGAGWDRDAGLGEDRAALWATYLPHHLDLYAAHLHPALFGDLTRDRGCGVAVMDALARRRPGTVEASALALGLAAKDVRVRTSAQDALLDLARYGVLDGAELGSRCADHLADGTVVGQRLVGGLSAVANGDDAAVLPVLAALEMLLPVTAERRDAASFVNLAADLTQRSARKIAVPQHLTALAAGRSTSLAAKAARRLV